MNKAQQILAILEDKFTVMYKGKRCKAELVNIYVKRGAYAHDNVKGWQLVDEEGNVVVDGHPGTPKAAYSYEQPRFPTKKSLLSWVEDDEEQRNRLAARRAAKEQQ